jgi:hypothetical protein
MKYRVLTIDPGCPEAKYLLEQDREDGTPPIKHWVHCDNTLPFGCWFRGELTTNVPEDEFYRFKPGNTII